MEIHDAVHILLLWVWHYRQKQVPQFQRIFELFIIEKTGFEIEDEEYTNIMNKLWKRLQETHKLRVVK